MRSFQSIVGDLLIESRASRVMLLLASSPGDYRAAAEAVTHGARQVRNDPAGATFFASAIVSDLDRDRKLIVHDDLDLLEANVARPLIERYGARSQVLAPVVQGGRLAGFLAVQRVDKPAKWEERDLDAIRQAQAAAAALLEQRSQRTLAVTNEDLRDSALQAILDRLRTGLGVQRCTLRQNVSSLYAFPVTHESRGEGVWSLRGDFTIVQSGQPVIEMMLRDRAQVVQNETQTASTEPLFHVMLKHYGDMRAQIVTPLFREDTLAAVLSIHNLKTPRVWTAEEMATGRFAARMLGLLIGATLA